jgi:amino acid permease
MLLLYINRSSLSHSNKEKNDALIVLCSVTLFFLFVYQNNENMVYYSSTIKGDLVSLSLSLSFTHFTMINKKRTSLLSAKIGTDISNYGKMDTF